MPTPTKDLRALIGRRVRIERDGVVAREERSQADLGILSWLVAAVSAARIIDNKRASHSCSSRLDEALPDYAKAYQYRPDDQRFADAYAYALHQQRDYPKAESVLQELVRTPARAGGAENPAAYRAEAMAAAK